eukprot:GEMP01064217.1.p3 GENE.GEMP01064217.1~~GEMP01064217.1.p3  ORF type:complete len:111 (-),score=17.11 GEMP01064217.1:163-495(-)
MWSAFRYPCIAMFLGTAQVSKNQLDTEDRHENAKPEQCVIEEEHTSFQVVVHHGDVTPRHKIERHGVHYDMHHLGFEGAMHAGRVESGCRGSNRIKAKTYGGEDPDEYYQ